jgi:CRISPR-associated protein Cas1
MLTASEGEDKSSKPVRRLIPTNDDALPMYVQEQGSTVGKIGDELRISSKKVVLKSVRIMDVSQLILLGNAQATEQTLRELCYRGIPICHMSYGGWFYGITTGMTHKNVELRQKQFSVAGNSNASLELAKKFVESKIINCRTILRRNYKDIPGSALKRLADLADEALKARNSGELLGIEGTAARVYFMHFKGMLKPESARKLAFDFNERNRRPPRDPINALLSFVYSMMAKDFTVTLLSVGFDPYMGFYHVPKYGRPALSLDMMEEFRPIIGDSVVIGLLNNEQIKEEDFIKRAGSCALTDKARKEVILAYEKRLDSLIRHPIFKYEISYRRVLEVQARLLGRVLTGEIDGYTAFTTR